MDHYLESLERVLRLQCPVKVDALRWSPVAVAAASVAVVITPAADAPD